MRWGALALMLALGGCAQVELPPLSARVTIEESGEVIGSADVYGFSYAGIDRVFIDVDSGARLFLSLSPAVPLEVLVPFEGEPSSPELVPVEIDYTIGPGPMGDVISILCASHAGTMGGLTMRARSWDADGNINGLVGTLRVRFVGCEETDDGMALGDVTFVVDFPAP